MEEMQWLDLSIICSIAEKNDSPYSAARWVVAPFVPIIPNPCFPSLKLFAGSEEAWCHPPEHTWGSALHVLLPPHHRDRLRIQRRFFCELPPLAASWMCEVRHTYLRGMEWGWIWHELQ